MSRNHHGNINPSKSLKILLQIIFYACLATSSVTQFIGPSEEDTLTMCWANCSFFKKSDGPFKVHVGGIVNKAHDMDIDSQTIKMDVFVWLRWENCTLNSQGIPFAPHKTFILSNAVDRWGLTTLNEVNSCDEVPGYAYLLFRVEGSFHQKFSFDFYPLDVHKLVFTIEEEWYDASELIYVADTISPASLGLDMRFPGWQISDVVHESLIIRHSSSWGITGYQNLAYSRYNLGFVIKRPVTVYLVKILPPILITQFVALGTFLIDVEYYDTRVATATGALLAEIFLQLSFGERLPRGIDYLTLMDLVFNISYFTILIVIVENIVVRYYFRKIDDDLGYTYVARRKITKNNQEEATELKSVDGSDDSSSDYDRKAHKKEREILMIRTIMKVRKMDFYCFCFTTALSVIGTISSSLAYLSPVP